MKAEQLIFKPRVAKPKKHQVRFWSSPERYGKFTETCDRHGLKYQDVFNEFMEWFIAKNVAVKKRR